MRRLARTQAPGLLALGLALLGAAQARARAEGPADPLLRLVPADAAATLVVEDLAGHAREILGSPLVAGLRRLPAVAGWLDGEAYRAFARSRRDLEAALGVDLATLRDEVLGRAVVLALHVPEGAEGEDAFGLLLVRGPDAATMGRLVDRLNAAERGDGKLRAVEDRPHAGRPGAYRVRVFRPETGRPPDAYALLDDGVLAWSNSEALIRSVLDRRGGRQAGSLGADPRFLAVRDRLPSRALASLFVDPRFVERALARAPRPDDPAGQPVLDLLARYLGAVVYAGAGLEWRDGPILHVHETVDPAALEPWQRRWAGRAGRIEPLLRRVPADAPAVAAGLVDFEALRAAAVGFVPAGDWPKLETLAVALRGLLLDRDPKSDILPNLGPAVVAYAGSPPEGPAARPPLVAAIALGEEADDRAGVGPALANALRTVAALVVLDKNNAGKDYRLETRGDVVALVGGRVPLAFAVGRGCLVLGTSPEAVAGYLAADPAAAEVDSAVRRLRAEYFPDAQTFACVDLEAVAGRADAWRAAVAAPPEDVDQVLALLGLFRGAFATNRIDPEFRWVHRTVGLVARDAPAPALSPSPPGPR